jgi:hypothetical protein
MFTTKGKGGGDREWTQINANEAATKWELSGEDGGDVCGTKINPSGTGWSVEGSSPEVKSHLGNRSSRTEPFNSSQ